MNDVRHFEDFVQGEEGRTHGRLVTDTDIWAFAAMSGDFHPVHFDQEFAAGETALGGRVAHGLFGVCVATGLLARDAPEFLGTRFAGLAFLGVEWRFEGPLLVGATLHVRYRVAATRETSHPERGLVELALTVEDQDGRVLQRGKLPMLVRRRAAMAAARPA